jgi:hypothetical protein
MSWSQIRAIVAIAMVASVSCGCAMYSPTRDQQGQAVKQTWSQVDLKSQVEVPRQNLAALLVEQLSLEDELWAQRRDDEARKMVSSYTVASFRSAVNGRLKALAGSTKDPLPIREAAAKKELADEALATDRGILAAASVKPPSCNVVADPAQRAKFRESIAVPDGNLQIQVWDGMLNDYVEACERLSDSTNSLLNIGGAIAQANAQLASDKRTVDLQKKAIASTQQELKEAETEYVNAVNAETEKPGTAQTRVSDALAKLETANSKVAANSFAKKVISQQRLDGLQKFLSTYDDAKDGKAVQGGSKAAIALAEFPDLVDKAKATMADVEKPNLVPLAIQKNIEQQKLEEAQRDVDRQEKLVALRQAQVANLLAQTDSYEQVARGLDSVWPKGQDGGLLRDALVPYAGNPANNVRERKQKTWIAAARYLDASSRFPAEFAKNRYRITALAYEETLTVTESGINQWKVLIDPSVELMADYGASGTKTSDIKGLLDTLMLLGIAIGVN